MKLTKIMPMHFLKRCIAALLLPCCAIPAALSQDVQECLVVHLKNGSQVSYVLADKPVVTCQGASLHVESASIGDDHAISDVEKFTFEKKTNSIDTVVPDETRIIVTADAVTLLGLDASVSVTLADIQGRVFAVAVANADGHVSISTERCAAGIYVVALSNGHAFKIFKK